MDNEFLYILYIIYIIFILFYILYMTHCRCFTVKMSLFCRFTFFTYKYSKLL